MFLYVNSLDSVKKFGVSTRVYRAIMSFSRDDTYQWNHTSSDPLRLMSNSFKIRDNRQNTWIHMKTHTGGAVPITNQYDTCQLVQKWFLVCWDGLTNYKFHYFTFFRPLHILYLSLMKLQSSHMKIQSAMLIICIMQYKLVICMLQFCSVCHKSHNITDKIYSA